ncbi:MAG TPA: 30S ribosome-binding factor RbfA [Thermodesulfobacteriota bacterium]
MSFQRKHRVADAIKAEVSDLLRRGLKDPRIGFVTVTDVEVSSDLRQARVYYSVVGSPAEREATEKGLQSATGFVQSHVGKRLGLRNTPTLEFRYDPSLEQGARIEQLLREARAHPPDTEADAGETGRTPESSEG